MDRPLQGAILILTEFPSNDSCRSSVDLDGTEQRIEVPSTTT